MRNLSRASRPLRYPSSLGHHWDFDSAERELTNLPVLRYGSGQKKGGLDFSYMRRRSSQNETTRGSEPRSGTHCTRAPGHGGRELLQYHYPLNAEELPRWRSSIPRSTSMRRT